MRIPSAFASRMASVRALVLVLCRPSEESQSGLLPYALYKVVVCRHCSSSILGGCVPASFVFICASISVADTPLTEVSFSGAQVCGFSGLPARAASLILHPPTRATVSSKSPDALRTRGRGGAVIEARICAESDGG